MSALLGAEGSDALARDETAVVRSRLSDVDSPLATLVRMWLLGDAIGVAEAERAVPVADAAPLLRRDGDQVRAAFDLRPYGADDVDWWVLSDRTGPGGRPTRPDHVVGLGPAAISLAQLTVRRPVRRALDIGTGSGVQALHLSTHVAAVTATDISARALQIASTTFALNDVDVRLVEGDLVAPVGDQRFDLVVCNPPFVMGPDLRYVYRDSRRSGDDAAGDDMSRRAVQAAASVLDDDGVAQVLVNWLHRAGEDWQERVADWVAGLGCDAWVVQRDVVDPGDYVSTWLADAGDVDEEELALRWLRWFADQRAEAAAVGWVVLRRTSGTPVVRIEDARQPVQQPVGPAVGDWLEALEWLRRRDDEALMRCAFRLSPDVQHELVSRPDPAGWRPAESTLVLTSGFRWRLPCDEALAGLVGACDGTRPLAAMTELVALTTGRPVEEVSPAIAAAVRELVLRGILLAPA